MKQFFQKRIVKDATMYISTNAIIQASSFIGVLIVSRYLGPTNIGIYSFVQNYIAAFVTIISGFDVYANWSIVHSKNFYHELIKYTKLKSIIIVALTIPFIFLSFLVLPRAIFLLSLLLILPILTNIFSSFIFVLQYQNKVKLVTVAMTVSAVFLLLLKIIAVLLKLPLGFFIAINAFDGVILSAFCVYYMQTRQKVTDVHKVTFNDFLKLCSLSFFPVAYVCATFIFVRVDQFFVPLYFNAYRLGVYSVAVKVVEMSNIIAVILQALVIPRVFLLQNPDKDRVLTHTVALAYLFFGLITACGIYVLAPHLTQTLFGSSYNDAIGILKIYAWSIPGLFVSNFFAVIAMSRRSFKQLALMSIFLASLAVVLSFFAAKIGSITLVASVSVFVYTTSAVMFYIAWRQKIF